MSKKWLAVLAAVAVFLCALFGLRSCRQQTGPRTPQLAPLVPATTPPPPPPPSNPLPKIPGRPLLKTPSPRAPVPPPSGVPVAPKVELHKELIPKDITIVRCYYNIQGVAPPGTTFGFDINGSGFTTEFQKMISVEAGVPAIKIQNLRLVTANQIHGDMVVETDATTEFVYPRVLIKGLPVFSAPEPFAVVRPGEVLTSFFISMDENGRGGRFRVITNIDDAQFKQFQVVPSTHGLEISGLDPHLPYVVEGALHIGPGLPPGAYGLAITIGSKTVFHHEDMIHIVRPNVGQSGFVLGLVPLERFHRQGDAVQLYLQGTGFTSADAGVLHAAVDEYEMGPGSFTYLSPVQMRIAFQAPGKAPSRGYGVTITGAQKESLYHKADVFQLIDGDWVAGVQVSPPVKPGAQSLLKIMGRDFSADFLKHFHIDVDEAGITLANVRTLDANTLGVDIVVSSSVAPGDYWLHLSNAGRRIDPPYGSLIKVQAN